MDRQQAIFKTSGSNGGIRRLELDLLVNDEVCRDLEAFFRERSIPVSFWQVIKKTKTTEVAQ